MAERVDCPSCGGVSDWGDESGGETCGCAPLDLDAVGWRSIADGLAAYLTRLIDGGYADPHAKSMIRYRAKVASTGPVVV